MGGWEYNTQVRDLDLFPSIAKVFVMFLIWVSVYVTFRANALELLMQRPAEKNEYWFKVFNKIHKQDGRI